VMCKMTVYSGHVANVVRNFSESVLQLCSADAISIFWLLHLPYGWYIIARDLFSHFSQVKSHSPKL